MVIDLEVYYDLNDRISTHVNAKPMQKSKSAHHITVSSKLEKWHMTLSKVIDVVWTQCTSERSRYHYISAMDGYHSATCTSMMTCTTSYRCADNQQKPPSSQVTGVETLQNATLADMTLKAGHRSNKGHGKYNLEIFREDANFPGLGTHNFVTISRIVRVLFSENPRRGCNLHQHPYQPAYPSSKWHIFI